MHLLFFVFAFCIVRLKFSSLITLGCKFSSVFYMGCVSFNFMPELIISEKPDASKRIAEALADGKVVRDEFKGVSFYRIVHKKRDVIVGCAVGHLFGLAEKVKKKGFEYPVFDIEWVPTSDISKGSAFTKKYLDTLKKIAKECSDYWEERWMLKNLPSNFQTLRGWWGQTPMR